MFYGIVCVSDFLLNDNNELHFVALLYSYFEGMLSPESGGMIFCLK